MEDAYNLLEKGKKLSKENRFLEAIMFLEKAKEIEPEKGSIRETLARAYYNSGLYSSAKDNFRKALDIDIANDYAHYGLGLCLIRMGKLNIGLGHLKMALAMKPDSEMYRKTLNKFI